MSQAERPAAADDADLSGRTLGDFRLLRRLGRGAMAEVYLAEQQKLRRSVAIKVLKSTLAGDANYVQRFQNEARAAAALVHANIVQIYEVGMTDGVHYIAQEYVQGLNLREWMERNGRPDSKAAIAILRQTAAALHKAAQAGIVHRDIKPENILLSKTGEVKVADFGLARITREDDVLHLTQVGITMGTPLYMSPEQVEGKPLDPRSDLYSFGVMSYHLLGGSPPFTGETALAVAVQHLNNQPRRLDELRPDLLPGLCRIVHRLMEKKPEQRFASAGDVLRELRALIPPTGDEADENTWADLDDDSRTLSVSVNGGRTAAVDKLAEVMQTSALVLRRQEKRRKRWVWVGIAAFVLGGAAAVVKDRRSPSVLAGTTRTDTHAPPKQNSAQAQFIAAQMQLTDTEAWLLSVERYYPGDAYFVARSKQELARLYWHENRLDEALALFNDFAGRLEQDYKAFGLAGQSLIQTKRGDLQRAAPTLGELMPLRSRLDPRMQQELEYAIAANRQALQQAGVLPQDAASSTVPKQASAEKQLYFASMQLGNDEKEDALKSVALYFPEDTYYVTAAKYELMKHHLQLHRWQTAQPLCHELAAVAGDNRELLAAGTAGEAIVALRSNQLQPAERALQRLRPLQDAVDPALATMLADALAANESRLPNEAAKIWDAWRNKTTPKNEKPRK